jgi:hypothetical protein
MSAFQLKISELELQLKNYLHAYKSQKKNLKDDSNHHRSVPSIYNVLKILKNFPSVDKELSQDDMLNAAREGIIKEFRDKFLPTDRFQSDFGPKQWSEVEKDVLADVQKFGTASYDEVYNNEDGSLTYGGRIYDLYTEVQVDTKGKVVKVYFEID